MKLSRVPAVMKLASAGGDGARILSQPVPIPAECEYLGLEVPLLDADSIVYVEVNPGGYPLRMQRLMRDPALVALWLCESQGAPKDETDRNNDLSEGAAPTYLVGPSPQDGWGITFDGTDDYLKIAHASVNGLDITTGDFTVIMALKMAASAAKQVIWSKRADAGGDGVGYEGGITITDSYPYGIVEDADQPVTKTADAAIDDGLIHMVHWTFDRSANANIYIDGAAAGAGEDISSVEKTLTNDHDFRIGCDSADTEANFFNGQIYGAAVLNDVRTAKECYEDARGNWYPVIDPADGQDLVCVASTYDPAFIDLTRYAMAARGGYIRVLCGTLQTDTHEQTFNFWMS